MINYFYSGRSPSPQKILLQKLFVDTQFKCKSRGTEEEEEEEEAGGIAMSLSWDAACNAYAFVRPFLWAAHVGEFILPWSSSKPGEQPAFLVWITDACTVSEMKSLATQLPSLPHFTHLAYSICVLWKFTTSCALAGFRGLYDRIVINCFVVLGGGHCILGPTCSVLFFSHWFPWVIPGSVMYRTGRERRENRDQHLLCQYISKARICKVHNNTELLLSIFPFLNTGWSSS